MDTQFVHRASQLNLRALRSQAGQLAIFLMAIHLFEVHVLAVTDDVLRDRGGAVFNVRSSAYGAAGTGATDDAPEIQAALNAAEAVGGGEVIIPATTAGYRIDSTLEIPTGVRLKGMGAATLIYTGSGAAIDGKLAGGTTYAVSAGMESIGVICNTAGATGIRCRFSYSRFDNVSVGITASNQTGWELPGDGVNGTGPYYNSFLSCDVQGKRGINGAVTNQKGWNFTYHPSYPSRGPNTNAWFGGRVGQVDVAWRILGNGNQITNVTCEGVIGTVFKFENPDYLYGCVHNYVRGGYVEGATGATVISFHNDALECGVDSVYITSIGVTGVVRSGNGKNCWVRNEGYHGIYSGTGAPNIAAAVGSLYLRTDGGSGTTLYVKESGTGISGWVAK